MIPAHDSRTARILRAASLAAAAVAAVLVCSASAAAAAPLPAAAPQSAAPLGAALSARAPFRATPLTASPLTAVPLTVAPLAAPVGPNDPKGPVSPVGGSNDGNGVTISVPGQQSQVLQIILLITVLGVAPAVLLLTTSFTKIVVVLSLTRSALGTPSIPPNQVLIGLALFLSLFVMGPTIDQIQSQALKPYSAGDISASIAYKRATVPLQTFMLKHTRDEDLALMTKAADEPLPKDRASVELRTLIPAFVLSELRGAFIIGFVIFIPFLVIDVVVSAILMSLGMVMLPPSLVSLPFKLLLFVLVDGWTLIITTLIGSYK
jgi:flagellar biosynthetic protein FliP